MKQMFESATLKLTIWYLAILMSICIFFSVIIYQTSTSEIQSRFDTLEERFGIPLLGEKQTNEGTTTFRESQLHEAQISLLVALLYSNLAILVLGGLGSYFLARRSLQPLEASHEAITRFTSDASHELRTPLAVMKSELEVALRDTSLTKAEMKELLNSNLEEVNRLTELSQTLLQLSRQEYASVEMKRIDLTTIVRRAIKALGAPTKRLAVDIAEKTTVRANESSLTELIMILLDNALRYSPEDSTVTIKASKRAQSIQLAISNTGKGIAAADLPYVFDRFYRGDKSRTGGQKTGYGLGLSLAKKIADIHDAAIDITSKPDVLTTVKIRFKK